MTEDSAVSRQRWRLPLFLLLFAAFSIVSLGNALHKGGDFRALLIGGQRFLDGAPLYEGSGPGIGVTWPPFQSIGFAPFAAIDRISDGLARIVWYLLNLGSVIAGVWCWSHAIFPGRFQTFANLFSSSDVLLPLAAIMLPLQTNFEHQNMNALLL